jgi:NAD(P)-dependent dehydrogenase (short-subunit alcohol dehydrogenase family)
VADAIQAEGGRVLALAADVSDEAAISAAIAQTVDHFGRLNIVYANAGINGMRASIEELTLDEWRATLDTNLTGTFLTVKHAIPHLRAAGGGSIVVTASLNGTEIFSTTGFTAYSTSKAGQVAFAKMAAFELARWGIRVNIILPGSTQTNIRERTYERNLDPIKYPVKYPDHFPPLHGRPAQAEEIAEVALFLASDASRYMSGAVLTVDAAMSLVRS